jgi:dTDP-4-dehydrorhamnose reductase
MHVVLVTGANGFVASVLCPMLAGTDNLVVATSKGENRTLTTTPRLLYEPMDFTNEEQVALVFDKYKPSVVVHCGAMSKPDDCELDQAAAFRVNVDGTKLLLRAAERYAASFVFLSTDFVFSGERGMYSEEDRRAPVNYYGYTKLLAEDEVFHYPYRWSVVRTVLVYGPPGKYRPNLLTSVAASLQQSKPMKIFGDQVRTPTFVNDLAGAVVQIVHTGALGIFHISGEDVLTPFQMAVETAKHLHLDASLIERVEEQGFEQPARRPLRTGFNLAKANRELGYQPVSFEEGLRKTFPS